MSALVRFDEYMAQCLYSPDGFYATTGRAGQRRGDFITSPEVGPLFGEVVANAIDSWWEELGSPADFTIYDVGCGPGALLRSIRMARPDHPWNLIGVDVAAAASGILSSSSGKADIQVLTELPDDIEGSVVLGNELLDNIPFRIVEKSGDGLTEVFVSAEDVDGEPRPVEVVRPMSAQEYELVVASRSGVGSVLSKLPVGSRVPLLSFAFDWVQSTLERGPSRVCLFDYGTATTAELADRGGWLRTYRQHERGDDPYVGPEQYDITTDVPIDQLPTPSTAQSQAEFLRSWGIDELVEQGRAHWKQNAQAPNVAALKMRSRVSESEALLSSSGLGSWNALTWDCSLR